MDIKEIQEKKRTLIKEMSILISNFQDDTNVTIESLESLHVVQVGHKQRLMILEDVRIGL